MVSRVAGEGAWLAREDLAGVVEEAFRGSEVDGKRVLFLIPDQTRSMPMPAMFRALCETLRGRAAKTDFLIALGTHPPMTDEMIGKLLGISATERDGIYRDVGIFNHAWKDPNALVRIGTIAEAQIAEISDGLMRQSVDVTLNKLILDYDILVVVGPVFPHEVVGFSGGNKYFFPGIAGQEIIDVFHWLGALISNPVINGTKHTPVREVVDLAASFIQAEKRAFCLNVMGKDCRAVFFGTPEESWSAAADLSAQTHITYKDHPYRSVLAMAPEMYDEIWVAGKCMYKLEPVVADGGELIIYGKHIHEVSVTHGHYIKRIGYHTRDYFLAQMDRFADIPGGILAHSTHVRGIGTYENGIEKPRVQVTLATSIPEVECRAINLGYRDPDSINPDDWRDREDEGLLLVPHAGEVLYRLKENNPRPKPPVVQRNDSETRGRNTH
ncbi:MAG TPA: lactate racemase domain-containing protein [Candidatus Hydrogenedentes bacterium]|nr:lactate racemase domain-containing protein [Candidatus Hydrogenedentota bacterium]HPG65384.1 lactate racemase domain-containing protein [Candidatus Hydrogenedentota bacterium]